MAGGARLVFALSLVTAAPLLASRDDKEACTGCVADEKAWCYNTGKCQVTGDECAPAACVETYWFGTQCKCTSCSDTKCGPTPTPPPTPPTPTLPTPKPAPTPKPVPTPSPVGRQCESCIADTKWGVPHAWCWASHHCVFDKTGKAVHCGTDDGSACAGPFGTNCKCSSCGDTKCGAPSLAPTPVPPTPPPTPPTSGGGGGGGGGSAGAVVGGLFAGLVVLGGAALFAKRQRQRQQQESGGGKGALLGVPLLHADDAGEESTVAFFASVGVDDGGFGAVAPMPATAGPPGAAAPDTRTSLAAMRAALDAARAN